MGQSLHLPQGFADSGSKFHNLTMFSREAVQTMGPGTAPQAHLGHLEHVWEILLGLWAVHWMTGRHGAAGIPRHCHTTRTRPPASEPVMTMLSTLDHLRELTLGSGATRRPTQNRSAGTDSRLTFPLPPRQPVDECQSPGRHPRPRAVHLPACAILQRHW